MPGKFLSSLIEKQTIPVESMWCSSVLFNIPAKEVSRFWPEGYHSEATSLAEHGQRFLLWIKEIEIECGHFAGSGTGVEKQIEYGIISEALC